MNPYFTGRVVPEKLTSHETPVRYRGASICSFGLEVASSVESLVKSDQLNLCCGKVSQVSIWFLDCFLFLFLLSFRVFVFGCFWIASFALLFSIVFA